MANQPGVEPNNPFTRLIARVGELNASEGRPAGRSYSGPVSADPPMRVQSAAMRAEPLTPEEQAHRDQRARELGILEPDPNASGDEIIVPPQADVPLRMMSPRSQPGRQTAREFLADLPPRPTLPNFLNVQGFDLTTGELVIDGMSFPIPEEDRRDMKAYAVQIALDHIVAQLVVALVAFGLPQESAEVAADKLREGVTSATVTSAAETVLPLSSVSSAHGVSSQGEHEGSVADPLQDVREAPLESGPIAES